MTKQELEEDICVGDIVKITTKNGEDTGRVEKFGESAVKLTNTENGKPKRISYEFIMDYDIIADTVGLGIDPESKLIPVPGTYYRIGITQVTQRLYKKVMGENPSYFQNGNTANNPVENISWFDAIYFCNKLSMKEGLTPAYSVDGETDPEYWGYAQHQDESIESEIECNFDSNGYRLPTNDEWEKAANGGKSYTYSGSDNLNEVGWYGDNSNNVTHPVAQKMANNYGLYDMSGNVWEWIWESSSNNLIYRFNRGGCCILGADYCEVTFRNFNKVHSRGCYLGFRLLRPLD